MSTRAVLVSDDINRAPRQLAAFCPIRWSFQIDVLVSKSVIWESFIFFSIASDKDFNIGMLFTDLNTENEYIVM